MGTSYPFLSDDAWIAPDYRISDWRSAQEAGNWDLMVSIFRTRLDGRYLQPIRLIEKDKSIGPFAGFSILALDCLLIETLNQFYQGLDETPNGHEKQFWRFFQDSEHFSEHFSEETAGVFYRHIRCGLLHQAQTKKMSFIRVDQLTMIQATNGEVGDGIIVDRVRFHQAVEQEIVSYTKKLKDGHDVHFDLRANFLKKMQFICGDAG